jgi:hypothetical protein
LLENSAIRSTEPQASGKPLGFRISDEVTAFGGPVVGGCFQAVQSYQQRGGWKWFTSSLGPGFVGDEGVVAGSLHSHVGC